MLSIGGFMSISVPKEGLKNKCMRTTPSPGHRTMENPFQSRHSPWGLELFTGLCYAGRSGSLYRGGHSSMVEHWFVVPGTRVRFPLIAPLDGSSCFVPVAQWIEYLASNQGVAGSIPAGHTRHIESKSPCLSGIFAFPVASSLR